MGDAPPETGQERRRGILKMPGLREESIMDSPVSRVIDASFGFSPLIDIAICVGIIFAIGFFLWNKGRVSISHKR